MTSQEKEKMIKDLKETAKDFPRLGNALIQPLISFIEKKYEKISPEKKEKIKETIQQLKQKKDKGVKEIKEILKNLKQDEDKNEKNK